MAKWDQQPYGYRLGAVIAAAVCVPLLFRLFFADWPGTVAMFTSNRTLWLLVIAVCVGVATGLSRNRA